jgi:hypothetical protein
LSAAHDICSCWIWKLIGFATSNGIGRLTEAGERSGLFIEDDLNRV